MNNRVIPFFSNRTPEEIFFGTIGKYTEQEIQKKTKMYLFDVIKFLFGEIPNDKLIFVPVKNLELISHLYSIDEIKYHIAGSYFIFESDDKKKKQELIEQIKSLFKQDFPLVHYKYSMPRSQNSLEIRNFTENSFAFHELLPFPCYKTGHLITRTDLVSK